MGMYTLIQIVAALPKTEDAKDFLKQIAFEADIHDVPADLVTENGSDSYPEAGSLEVFVEESHFYAFDASKSIPAKAKSSYIEEKDDKYIIYLPSWTKGGYFDTTTKEYTPEFFADGKTMAFELLDFVEPLGGVVKYDVRSETEKYTKRSFRRLEDII